MSLALIVLPLGDSDLESGNYTLKADHNKVYISI